MIKQYHKIDSVFFRHEKSKKFIKDQYARREFELLKDIPWSWTEKLDGTNVRLGWVQDQKFHYGGRTDEAQLSVSLMEFLQETIPEGKIREVFPDASELHLFGEGIGKNIQKVGKLYNPDRYEFVLIDVQVGPWWLERKNVWDVARKLGLPHAPEIGRGTIAQAMEKCAQGFPSIFGQAEAEGIVLRLDPDLFDRSGHRIITKLKKRDFVRGWHQD